ncbi:ABC transporter substrate-binding protein [Streptomyces yaizuensis]|uniref:ABC transporter substrate-binding protein n=1 Tax=Streptomyces yaizuensis TaxID=2989713 RepID=A0ABQ5NXD3_9ACTN|nr:ABC transporter substrate-binding protein [Streptomyces sp. YSPA8]
MRVRIRVRTLRRWAATVLAGTLITGCGAITGGDSGDSGGSGSAARPGGRTDRSVAPITPARTVTDVHRVTVTTPRPPERVVCLVALCDDMLSELGMVPVATNSELLAHPRFLGKERAARIPSIPGGFLSPEAEAVLSHRPDLVIGLADTHGRLAPALKGATVFWPVQPGNWQESVRYLRDLAALTGRTAQAERAEQRFRDKLARAENDPSDRTSLIVFGDEENFGVATPGTDVTAGLFPRLSHYPWKSRGVSGAYSLEEILARKVDVLFVETLTARGSSDGPLAERLAQHPLWSKVPAVRAGEVHEVDADVWAKGRGTRSLGIVLDEATAKLR